MSEEISMPDDVKEQSPLTREEQQQKRYNEAIAGISTADTDPRDGIISEKEIDAKLNTGESYPTPGALQTLRNEIGRKVGNWVGEEIMVRDKKLPTIDDINNFIRENTPDQAKATLVTYNPDDGVSSTELGALYTAVLNYAQKNVKETVPSK